LISVKVTKYLLGLAF